MQVAAFRARTAGIAALLQHLLVHQTVVTGFLGARRDAGVVRLAVLTLDGCNITEARISKHGAFKYNFM